MPVSLVLWNLNSEHLSKVWRRLLDDIHRRAARDSIILCVDENQLIDQYIEEEFRRFGAYTDWSNQNDPLWFPDEESRAHFLLVWG